MLRQIRYFQAIARLGNFTEAAEECYISQSAISQQLQALEQELGVKLVDRSKRKISLTPAGEHFYTRSLVITADFEKLCRETVRIANRDKPQLRIGYLRGYSGNELQLALADFSVKYPKVEVHIASGNHEELYDLIRLDGADIVISDQRRAFSDEYNNFHLITSSGYIEVASHSPLAQKTSVNVDELRSRVCILVASKAQQENEESYYRDIIGLSGEFLFAENLEEARMLIIGGKGYMPVETGDQSAHIGQALSRIPLLRKGKPITHNICAFWKIDNSGDFIEDFADILKSKFPE